MTLRLALVWGQLQARDHHHSHARKSQCLYRDWRLTRRSELTHHGQYMLAHCGERWLTKWQESSLKLVPANKTKSASVQDTANSLGLHDTMRYGPRSLAAEIETEGNLKGRLQNVCGI